MFITTSSKSSFNGRFTTKDQCTIFSKHTYDKVHEYEHGEHTKIDLLFDELHKFIVQSTSSSSSPPSSLFSTSFSLLPSSPFSTSSVSPPPTVITTLTNDVLAHICAMFNNCIFFDAPFPPPLSNLEYNNISLFNDSIIFISDENFLSDKDYLSNDKFSPTAINLPPTTPSLGRRLRQQPEQRIQ